jgi:hypothetical protein
MAFSASDSAFDGFRLIRREPAAIAAWAGFYLVSGLVLMAASLPLMRNLASLQANPTPSPAMVGSVLTIYAVLIPWALIAGSVICCAVYRSILRPEDRGVARLKFGGDELRMMGLWIVLGLLWIGVGLVLAIVLAVTFGLGFAAAQGGSNGLVAIIPILAMLLVTCLMVWVVVRLSLAGPMTFAERKLRVFDSWRLTRKRFWSLFGCYLLALVFVIIVEIVFYAVVAAIGLTAAGGSIQSLVGWLAKPETSSLQAYFTPMRIAYAVLAAPISAIIAAVSIAPAASAYKAITGTGPDQQAEVFT